MYQEEPVGFHRVTDRSYGIHPQICQDRHKYTAEVYETRGERQCIVGYHRVTDSSYGICPQICQVRHKYTEVYETRGEHERTTNSSQPKGY